MKNYLLIFLLSISLTSFSQYNYQTVITGGNNKTILNNVFDEYETFNRYANDTISFDSHSLIDSTYISNKCDSLGYTLEYFNKDKTLLANNYQTKACCNLLLELYDSWGDGWNGATLEVKINGNPTYHSVTGSSSTTSLSYCDGDIVEVIYYYGSWEGENSYTISNNHGIIFGDGPYPTSGLVFTSTEACSPPPSTPQDCEGATMVCSNTSFSGNSSGHGTQELNSSNRGCLLGNEHESSWYYINVGSSGTLEMTISPTASDDYDWAIWGPFTETTANANCPPVSDPIRCSYASTYSGYTTGMGNTATDNSEGASGDGWVAPLNVQEDEVYILLIDNYSASNNPFDLTWGGSAGLSCEEVSLPVELLYFEPVVKDGTVVLNWATGSETNNDYFTIERSLDGYNWDSILSISGHGNIATPTEYKRYDRVFGLSGIVYYRLSQTDYDGKREVFDIKSVFIHKKKILKIVNTLGQEVDINYKGLKIVIYDNGEQVKYK